MYSNWGFPAQVCSAAHAAICLFPLRPCHHIRRTHYPKHMTQSHNPPSRHCVIAACLHRFTTSAHPPHLSANRPRPIDIGLGQQIALLVRQMHQQADGCHLAQPLAVLFMGAPFATLWAAVKLLLKRCQKLPEEPSMSGTPDNWEHCGIERSLFNSEAPRAVSVITAPLAILTPPPARRARCPSGAARCAGG